MFLARLPAARLPACSAIVEVIKSLGKNLLAGNLDLLKVSLPVAMFEPRSYLQKLADPWVSEGVEAGGC